MHHTLPAPGTGPSSPDAAGRRGALSHRVSHVARLVVACALLASTSTAQAQPGELLDSLRIAEQSAGFKGPLDDADDFGAAVTRIGDLDGNGVAELAVGAPGDDDGGPDRGAVWILFRAADGTITRSSKISATAGLFTGVLDDGDAFGSAVASLGDLDGNGLPELAVGAPGDDDGGSVIFPDPQVGAVWILSLRRDGRVRVTRKISATTGGLVGPLNELDRFGSALAPMDDFDGDGTPDLAVGAPGDNNFGINAGAFWLLSLDAQGAVLDETKNPLGQSSAGTGAHLANIGDLNGDGVADVALSGAAPDPISGDPVGYALVAFLDADGTVLTTSQIIPPPGSSDDFGSAITSIPDLDGDGFRELAIGAAGHDGGGPERGAVWIAFMLPAGFVKGYLRIGSDTSAFTPSLQDGDALGSSLHGVEDDDGDGVPDLFVGAPGDDGPGTDHGAVWRLSLSDGTWGNVDEPLPGAFGAPELSGSGSLTPGEPVALRVDGALPGAAAWFVVGRALASSPFLGGVLVPRPDVVKGPFAVRVDGTLNVSHRWPAGVPAGTTIYYQTWILDPGGPRGFAATNGLSSTSP